MLNLIASFTPESGYLHVNKIFGYAPTFLYTERLQITETALLKSYIVSLSWNLSSTGI